MLECLTMLQMTGTMCPVPRFKENFRLQMFLLSKIFLLQALLNEQQKINKERGRGPFAQTQARPFHLLQPWAMHPLSQAQVQLLAFPSALQVWLDPSAVPSECTVAISQGRAVGRQLWKALKALPPASNLPPFNYIHRSRASETAVSLNFHLWKHLWMNLIPRL